MDTPYVGGETYRQLRERAQLFLERVVADPDWQTLVAVAHGGINNALLSVVLGKDELSGLLNVEQDFGCVNVLDHDGERFVLRLLNFTSYDPLKSGRSCRRCACSPLWSGSSSGSRRTRRDERSTPDDEAR